MGHISNIKLIRTDTTLDLSQKAEKGMICLDTSPLLLYYSSCLPFLFRGRCGTFNTRQIKTLFFS
ncbi:unnamed protein product [Brassica oleracea]|uniref:Uncharacterized protein n=1 Tax=Brassica oleracea TaxID=3712 RepID=A0A3P6A6C4_BRAOL|nr:unnamed protein product [Brassica oleracea]